jgi:hypothetical protein
VITSVMSVLLCGQEIGVSHNATTIRCDCIVYNNNKCNELKKSKSKIKRKLRLSKLCLQRCRNNLAIHIATSKLLV